MQVLSVLVVPQLRRQEKLLPEIGSWSFARQLK